MLDLFSRIAQRAPGDIAGWRDSALVRHGDFLGRVRAWAALGQRTGARDVALYLDDSLEFGAALAGAWLAGKTVWLVADTLPASCAALGREVGAFWGQFPPAVAPQLPLPADDWTGAWSAPAPDFPALVVHTSGSTGAPTPIRKQLVQLMAEVEVLEAQFGAIVAKAAVVSTVSHQHIYGLLFRVLWPLATSRPIEALRHEFPETLAPALGMYDCVLLASPAHIKRLPAHLDWTGARARLRAVFSSGGLLDLDAALHARTLLGQAPIEVYGSSETGGVAWRQRDGRGDDGWTPFDGVQWQAGEDGMLEVRSTPAGGVHRLADRVEALEGGRFILRGRADRIVKIEEKRVSLDAMEAALLASPLVREARVLACPDGARQSLAAFVVPGEEGAALLAEEGKAAFNARLRTVLAACVEAVALPRRWRYLERMPVNAQGKTTQAQLLALLGGQASKQAGADMRPRFPQVRVLEESAGRALLELLVPADLLYFDGHFDVAPVLPGVVQVDWALYYGRRYLGLTGTFGGINALKFQQMVKPGQPVQLELVFDAAKGSLNFRYFSDAGAHASGRILILQSCLGPESAC